MTHTLYYAQGACSMASHIALLEAKTETKFIPVNLKTHRTENQNFYDVNPKGSVPTLMLPNGERLTENVAILSYIADRFPQANLIPPAGTMQRYHVTEWLAFITSEVHKQFGAFFAHMSQQRKEESKKNLTKKFAFIDEQLRQTKYLCGPNVTVADFYLFVMESWAEHFELPEAKLSSVQRHLALMRERPSVQQMMKEEGLPPAKN